MKKLLFLALVIALVAFVGCGEETGTVVGGDDSSEAAESSSESSDDDSSEAAGSSSESGGDDETACTTDLPDATGEEDTTQDGDLKLGLSITPVFTPDGDWDGVGMPKLYFGEGCEYDDDDCLLHMSYDCARFDDPDKGEDVTQYIGSSFLNNNGWGATHTWGDEEPTKLVGYFKGHGKLMLSAFAVETEMTLTDEFQKVEITLDFDEHIELEANPTNPDIDPATDYEDEKLFGAAAGIGVSQIDTTDTDEIIWVTVKNLVFE